MRTLLAALTVALMLALTPVAAAQAEEVPDVTLQVVSVIYDPLKGATQTIRVGGDPSAVVRVYVDGYSTLNGDMTIQRGDKSCRDRAPCTGSGDITITYPKVDPRQANLLRNEGRVTPVSARAYADIDDQVGEYIAQAEGTMTVRYEFDAWIRWLPDVNINHTRPQLTLDWRVEGPPLLSVGDIRPVITVRVQGLGAYQGIETGAARAPRCTTEGPDIVCTLEYNVFYAFAFNLVSCPSRDISISISTNYYDPDPGNNQAYAPASDHMCAETSEGGSGSGSGGGSGGGPGSGPAGSPDPSGGPSGATSSAAPSSAAASPSRTGDAATATVTAVAAPSADRGNPWPAVVSVLGALLLAGAAGGWWFWRRRGAQ